MSVSVPVGDLLQMLYHYLMGHVDDLTNDQLGMIFAPCTPLRFNTMDRAVAQAGHI